jgi:hypothetical protein
MSQSNYTSPGAVWNRRTPLPSKLRTIAASISRTGRHRDSIDGAVSGIFDEGRDIPL